MFKFLSKPHRCSLTWEEKNPTDYLYHRSEAIKRLRKVTEEIQSLQGKVNEK